MGVEKRGRLVILVFSHVTYTYISSKKKKKKKGWVEKSFKIFLMARSAYTRINFSINNVLCLQVQDEKSFSAFVKTFKNNIWDVFFRCFTKRNRVWGEAIMRIASYTDVKSFHYILYNKFWWKIQRSTNVVFKYIVQVGMFVIYAPAETEPPQYMYRLFIFIWREKRKSKKRI